MNYLRQPYAIVDYIPQSGTKNLQFGLSVYTRIERRRNRQTVHVIGGFLYKINLMLFVSFYWCFRFKASEQDYWSNFIFLEFSEKHCSRQQLLN